MSLYWSPPDETGTDDMTITFRAALVLMIIGRYAFGALVRDPAAFRLRCQRIIAGDYVWRPRLRLC